MIVLHQKLAEREGKRAMPQAIGVAACQRAKKRQTNSVPAAASCVPKGARGQIIPRLCLYARWGATDFCRRCRARYIIKASARLAAALLTGSVPTFPAQCGGGGGGEGEEVGETSCVSLERANSHTQALELADLTRAHHRQRRLRVLVAMRLCACLCACASGAAAAILLNSERSEQISGARV